MPSIRDRIEHHLSLSDRLQKPAEEFLKAKITNHTEFDNEIYKIEMKYTLTQFMSQKFRQKVKILKKKEDYLALKDRTESAVEEAFRVGCTRSVSEKHKISQQVLVRECAKLKQQGTSYRYDEPISESGNFTYQEEFTMLEDLCTWKNNKDPKYKCYCQLCALEYLLTWAFQFGKKKNKKFNLLWIMNRKATVEWVLKYEMRHSVAIASNFKSFNKCEYATSKVKYPKAVHTYRSDLQSSDANISHASMQETSQQIPEVFDAPIASTSHAAMQESSQQIPEIFNDSIASTSPTLLQGNSKLLQDVFEVSMIVRDHFRKEIKEYLEVQDLLVSAAQEVIDKKRNIEEIARSYGFKLLNLLELKTYIVQKKRRYWELKDKIEEAIKHAPWRKKINVRALTI